MTVSPIYQAATSDGMPSGPNIETFEAFCARRACAYAAGELKARQREISADAYLFLYKELVGLSGERTYCWPGLEYLVKRLGRSEGTLKRWMKELERAGLVQRMPRPGGQTSLTYIMPYLQMDCERETEVCLSTCPSEEPEAESAGAMHPRDVSVISEQGLLPVCPSYETPAEHPVFFVPKLEIDSDPGERSSLISHTIKNQELKDRSGDGGGDSYFVERNPAFVTENEIIQYLLDEGIHDPQTVLTLQQKPFVELQAISGYLDKQTNIRSRPGLFVWLAQQGFGAKLLAGRLQKAERGTRRGKLLARTHSEPIEYLHEQEDQPIPAEFAELWQQVLDRVSTVLPKDIFDVWIKPTTLLLIDGDRAVVGTPNLFVREEVNQQHWEHLESAFTTLCGRPMVLEAVIG